MARMIKDVKKLQVRAARGDRVSQEALIAYNDRVAKEVNKRLRELERRGYAYGGYNTPTHFTEVMYDSNRFKTAKQLENDWYTMGTQTEIGVKFLSFESSTVEGQKNIEERRFQTFVDMEIVDEGYSRRKFRNFLKFLGNEEVSGIMESWSTSETMVEVLFDAYNAHKVSRQKMVEIFRKSLARTPGYDIFQAMKKVGVDLNDYRSTRWYDD